MSWRAGKAEPHGTRVMTDTGGSVAWVPAVSSSEKSHCVSPQEAHRRAVLMSASEDLLEALNMAVWAMRAPNDEWKGDVQAGALRAANAAIARATGEIV